MKILLIRHGEPDYEEDGLTEKGKREAAFLAGRIAPMQVKDYYVSPLGRAMETAEATLRKAGRKAEVCPWLREFDIPIVEDDGGKRPVPWNWIPRKWLSDPRFFSAEHWSENEVLEKVGVGPAYEEVVSAFDKLLSGHGYRREGMYYRVEEANTDTLVFFTLFGLSREYGAALGMTSGNTTSSLFLHYCQEWKEWKIIIRKRKSARAVRRLLLRNIYFYYYIT